jgi:pyrimidine-nucleoside phosphorylase
MYDVILAKRDGEELSREQMEYFIGGYVAGEIPDYQVSALLMAIFFKGLSERETADLTYIMSRSGDWMDLSPIPGIKVDKHSTGGVGDKTTLICAPIAAACGVPVAKMSGRGLGHTGGTIDKLESIPGYRIALEEEEFFAIVKDTGISVIGQTGDIAPADKKIYALRDVTATVDSLPLIASSIMSKKLASGADAIVLDVKTGSGALMKDMDGSLELARQMVAIGENLGRSMAALITNMDVPLGAAVGNSLEVTEAVETLRGRGPADLTEVCLVLASNMLFLAKKGSMDECRGMAERALSDGSATDKLEAMVAAQGGDVSYIKDTSRFPRAEVIYEYKAKTDGYVSHIDTEMIGRASVSLGAGRYAKEDSIDHAAGLLIRAKLGDKVSAGDVLAELHAGTQEKIDASISYMDAAYVIAEAHPAEEKLIYARVTKDGTERW